MNADSNQFEIPSDSRIYRVAIGALALLPLAAILAATMQIMDPAFGAAPVPRVTVVGHASLLHSPEDYDLPPAADEAPARERF